MWRLTLSLATFWGALAAGIVARRRGWLQVHRSRRMIELMIKALEPVIIGLSFWKLDLSHPRILLLPAIGCVVALSSLPVAWLLGRRLRLSPSEMGIYLPCAFFSNLGYLGAFVAFALYGETGFGLAQLYLLFFTPCFYTLGFGLAAHYGARRSRVAEETSGHAASLDRLQLYPIAGLVIGLTLNLLGVRRPAWCGPLNSVLIPGATAMYLIAIGSTLRVTRLQEDWRACLGMSAVKFLYLPLIGWLIGSAAGLGAVGQGTALRVAVLQASMPVATMPLVLPMLFHVDGELANHLWIVTTVLAVPFLPLVVWVLGRL